MFDRIVKWELLFDPAQQRLIVGGPKLNDPFLLICLAALLL